MQNNNTNTAQLYDIIGDIHGQADKLEQLLGILEYKKVEDVYQHPSRKAVFLGDFIDRGPNNLRVIGIVRPMIEQGYALAVMGNHEFNAICYHTPHPTKANDWLRPHTDSNDRQHQAFLDDYEEHVQEKSSVIAWFKTLPLFLELEGLRVIHACWSQRAIDRLKPQLGEGNTLTEKLIVEASEKGTETYQDIETLLKGPEFLLPNGASFKDKDGHVRHEIRVAWWGGKPKTYADMALSVEHVPSNLRDQSVVASAIDFYPKDAPPVFVGHYWRHGSPQAFCSNVACVDYSAGSNGPLTAYRWYGPDLYGRNYISAEYGPFTQEYLDAAAKHIHYIDEILSSKKVGCYYCLSVMPVDELTNPNGPEWCPRCNMDSLIGDKSGLPLTSVFLRRMHERSF